MRRLRFYIVSVYVAFLSPLGFAQLLITQFDEGINYTTTEGLGFNESSTIAEDNYGFIWVGGKAGVSRFDGSHFQNYETVKTKTGDLEIGWVTALYYDSYSRLLWVGSFSGLYYTPTDAINFKRYEFGGGLSVENARVNSMHFDKDGGLWIVGRLGLYYINLRDSNDSGFIYDENDPVLNKGTSIKDDPFLDGVLWIGSTNGLIRFDRFTKTYQSYFFDGNSTFEENQIRRLHVSKNGVYLGTWTAGLLRFDKNSEQQEHLFEYRQLNSDHKTIKELYNEGDNLWITTTAGLIQYDLQNEKILGISQNDFSTNLLRGLDFVDSRGIGWYGHNKGLFKYDSHPINQEFVHLEKRSDFETPFVPEKFINLKDYHYLVGYKSRGIYKIDANDLTVSVIRLPLDAYSEEGLVDITDMVQMETDLFLVLTDSRIFIYNSKSNAITLSELQVHIEEPAFQAVVKDRTNNTYWIGSRKGGLFHIDFDKGLIRQYKDEFNTDNQERFPWINYMYLDSQNKLWLARGSYTVMDLDTKKVYNIDKEKTETYLQDVSGFQEDSFGRIWFAGMSKGLGFTNYSNFEKGLTFRLEGSFNGVYKLNANSLWTVGDHLGILNTKSLSHEIIKHPKFNNEYRLTGPITKLSETTFFVGYENGFSKLHFNPNETNLSLPRPYIRAVAYKDRKIDDFGLGAAKIKLPKGTTNLVAKVSSLSFNYPFESEYEYKLDNEWIDVPDNNEISITNLKPGTLNIELRVKNSKGLSRKNYTLSAFIPKPILKTNVAYLIYVSLLIGVAFLLYRFLLSRQLAITEYHKLKELDNLRTSLYTNITHEFRTPITVIMGIVDILKNKKGSQDNKELNKSLSMIERNSEDLLKMVNHMLDLAKLENTEARLILTQNDVIKFIKYIFESFESAAKIKSIRYTFYSELEALIMDYDSEKLASIISNLITNAIKFTNENGSILLHLNTLKIGASNYLRIKVIDDGIGILLEEVNFIFDKFYQAQNSTLKSIGGSGLGLSLTKELVQLFNGNIRVKSQFKKGSEFIVELPITNNAAIGHDHLNTNESLHKNHLKQEARFNYLPLIELNDKLPIVLIIEDNRDVAEYLKMCLKPSYNIIHSDNGIDGIKMATTYVPDIIISDVMMPHKDGIELCIILKSEPITDHIPIVLVTAKATQKDRIAGLEAGADAYLVKPFSKVELLTRIDQLLILRKRIIDKFSSKSLGNFITNEKQDSEAVFLTKIISCIERDLDNTDFGPLQLANEMNLSESQVYRKLKAITGRSTAVFIRSVRLNIAKTMLKSQNRAVSEIAYAVGFKDASWFSRAFKEEFGYSPSEQH